MVVAAVTAVTVDPSVDMVVTAAPEAKAQSVVPPEQVVTVAMVVTGDQVPVPDLQV
jgi:hypothetical protein